MPAIDVAMAQSLRGGVWGTMKRTVIDSFTAEVLRRDVIAEAENKADDIKQTFTHWNICMTKDYCKWPAFAVIAILSIIVIGVTICIIRCCCLGLSCCCSCFRCLRCCGNCCGCCDAPGDRPHKYSAEPFNDQQKRPGGGYRQQAPMEAHFPPPPATAHSAKPSYTGPPQYAEFDVKKSDPDALPAMPSWEESQSKQKMIEEVEMDNLPRKEPPVMQRMPPQRGPMPGNNLYAAPEQPVHGYNMQQGSSSATYMNAHSNAYDQTQQHGFDQHQQPGYDQSQQHGYDQNQQHGYDQNQQHGYDQNQQHGYDQNQQHGYHQNQQHGYDQNQQYGYNQAHGNMPQGHGMDQPYGGQNPPPAGSRQPNAPIQNAYGPRQLIRQAPTHTSMQATVFELDGLHRYPADNAHGQYGTDYQQHGYGETPNYASPSHAQGPRSLALQGDYSHPPAAATSPRSPNFAANVPQRMESPRTVAYKTYTPAPETDSPITNNGGFDFNSGYSRPQTYEEPEVPDAYPGYKAYNTSSAPGTPVQQQHRH